MSGKDLPLSVFWHVQALTWLLRITSAGSKAAPALASDIDMDPQDLFQVPSHSGRFHTATFKIQGVYGLSGQTTEIPPTFEMTPSDKPRTGIPALDRWEDLETELNAFASQLATECPQADLLTVRLAIRLCRLNMAPSVGLAHLKDRTRALLRELFSAPASVNPE